MEILRSKTENDITGKLASFSEKIKINETDIKKLTNAQQIKKEQSNQVKKEIKQLSFQIGCYADKDNINLEKKAQLELKKTEMQNELNKAKETITKLMETKIKLMEEAKKLQDLEIKLTAENNVKMLDLKAATPRSIAKFEGVESVNFSKSVICSTPSVRSVKPLTTVIDSIHRELSSINTQSSNIVSQINVLESELKVKTEELNDLMEDKIHIEEKLKPERESMPEKIISSPGASPITNPSESRTRSYSSKTLPEPSLHEEKVNELKKHMDEKNASLEIKKQEYENQIKNLLANISNAESVKNTENEKEKYARLEKSKSEKKLLEIKAELEKVKKNITNSDEKINDILVKDRKKRFYTDSHLNEKPSRKDSTSTTIGDKMNSRGSFAKGMAYGIVFF